MFYSWIFGMSLFVAYFSDILSEKYSHSQQKEYITKETSHKMSIGNVFVLTIIEHLWKKEPGHECKSTI